MQVDHLATILRMVGVGRAAAKLCKSAKSSVKYFEQARVHILNIALVVDFLSREVEFSDELLLLHGTANFHEALDRICHDEIGVNRGLE